MSIHRGILAVGGIAALLPISAHAALSVTNGSMGTTNRNGQYIDGGGWFESTVTTNWIEGSWANPGSYPATFPTGSGMACLFDNPGYLYQSLGTIDVSFLNGSMSLTSDFAQKSDDQIVDCIFTVYYGSFTGANGTDIAGGGLTQLFTRTMSATDQGLTTGYASGRATNVAVNSSPIDLTGLAAGTEIWLRIQRLTGDPNGGNLGNGDVIIDNVAVTTQVPEPTAALLGCLGLIGLLRRRR